MSNPTNMISLRYFHRALVVLIFLQCDVALAQLKWTEATPAYGENLLAVNYDSKGKLFSVFLYGNNSFFSLDHGKSWTAINDDFKTPFDEFPKFVKGAINDFYLVRSGLLYKYNEAENKWEDQGLSMYITDFAVNEDHTYYIGAKTGIFVSYDYGKNYIEKHVVNATRINLATRNKDHNYALVINENPYFIKFDDVIDGKIKNIPYPYTIVNLNVRIFTSESGGLIYNISSNAPYTLDEGKTWLFLDVKQNYFTRNNIFINDQNQLSIFDGKAYFTANKDMSTWTKSPSVDFELLPGFSTNVLGINSILCYKDIIIGLNLKQNKIYSVNKAEFYEPIPSKGTNYSSLKIIPNKVLEYIATTDYYTMYYINDNKAEAKFIDRDISTLYTINEHSVFYTKTNMQNQNFIFQYDFASGIIHRIPLPKALNPPNVALFSKAKNLFFIAQDTFFTYDMTNKSWSKVQINLNNFITLDILDQNTIIADQNRNVFISHDQGKTFISIFSYGSYNNYNRSLNDIICMISSGVFYFSKDRGKTFSFRYVNIGYANEVTSLDGINFVAAGREPYISLDTAKTWESLKINISNPYYQSHITIDTASNCVLALNYEQKISSENIFKLNLKNYQATNIKKEIEVPIDIFYDSNTNTLINRSDERIFTQLYSIQGNLLQSFKTGPNESKILNNYPEGIYILQHKNSLSNWSEKISILSN